MENEAPTIPCMLCGKDLRNVWDDITQPSGGVQFTSYGNFGSRVFDPMNGEQLVIHFCDDCLIDRKDIILHRKIIEREVTQFQKMWKPYEGGGR